MNLLPLEIVHRILEYDGRIKYRNGKYMNQIAQDDDRYKMLLTVPKIETCYNHYLCMTITGNGNKIYYEKNVSPVYIETITIDTYSNTRYVQYIYYNQGFQYWLIIYKPPRLIIYKPQTPTFIESVLQNLYDLYCKIV